MKNKIIAVSILVMILFGIIGHLSSKIITKSNSIQSSLNRKEMYPMDSLRYKFL